MNPQLTNGGLFLHYYSKKLMLLVGVEGRGRRGGRGKALLLRFVLSFLNGMQQHGRVMSAFSHRMCAVAPFHAVCLLSNSPKSGD